MPLTRISSLIPSGPMPKTKAKLIAKLFPAIEAAVTGGYTHVEVHSFLVEHGVNISLNYYYDVTYRLRKKRASLSSTAQVGRQHAEALPDRTRLAPTDLRTKGNAGHHIQRNNAKFSVAFGQDSRSPSSNISNVRTSNGTDEFNPRNARNFDITKI